MAKQDDFIRITLRLPPGLHQRLTEAAGAKSLNAEIVERLMMSIEGDNPDKRAWESQFVDEETMSLLARAMMRIQERKVEYGKIREEELQKLHATEKSDQTGHRLPRKES